MSSYAIDWNGHSWQGHKQYKITMSTKEQRDAQLVAEGWTRRPDGYWEPPRQVGKPRPIYGTTELAPPKKRIRQSTKPLLNKLETEFLEVLKRRFNAEWIYPQAFRVKLGNGIWYKCDFFVMTGQPHAFEVKGPKSFRGGFENLKVAAHAYPHIKWHLVWKQDGTWQEQTILP